MTRTCRWCGVTRSSRSRLRLCFVRTVVCRMCRDCHRSLHRKDPHELPHWPRWFRDGEQERWFNKTIYGGFN